MRFARLSYFFIYIVIFSTAIFGQKLVYDDTFTPELNGGVDFVEILDNQKILIVGRFSVINGVSRTNLARLNPDGSLDESFNANWVSGQAITAMSVDAGGKIYIAGKLTNTKGNFGDHRVLRLNSDGTFDSTLTIDARLPQLENSSPKIRSVKPLPNGKFFICGKFTNVNFNPIVNVARYNSDGSFDSTFTNNFDTDSTQLSHECNDLEVQSDGKYLVSGFYTLVNGNSHIGLTRFNADDSIDTNFTAAELPNTPLTFYRELEILSDGTILAFQYKSNDNANFVSRLNSNGTIQATYPTELRQQGSNLQGDMNVQSNGKAIVVGEFDSLRQDFNRFNTNGTHDPSVDAMSFRGWSNSDDYLKAIEIDANEKVIVGGHFTRFDVNGVTTNRTSLARFTPEVIPIQPKYDFDGDGKDDLAVYRPSDRIWYVNQSTSGFYATQFGLSTDVPIAKDYDGDGRADIAVFRDGVWYWLQSSDGTLGYGVTGQAGDIPQRYVSSNNGIIDPPGLLVFRPTDAKFYIQRPFQTERVADMRDLEPTIGDIPVLADYDGDGTSDMAVFSDGDWFFLASDSRQLSHFQFGIAGDKPVVGDYDGDGRADYAVFRPSNRVWYIQKSTEGFFAVQWGLADDLLVPADYDGDGKTDVAVYRDGIWYILHNDLTHRIEWFGLAGDVPAQLR